MFGRVFYAFLRTSCEISRNILLTSYVHSTRIPHDTFHYARMSLKLEENLACFLLLFYRYTLLILTLCCLFTCFINSYRTVRLLVLEYLIIVIILHIYHPTFDTCLQVCLLYIELSRKSCLLPVIILRTYLWLWSFHAHLFTLDLIIF